MKIVSFKICPFVQRVTAALAAKGIDYDIEYISLKDKPQWFLDISPNGQVPILIADNGEVIFESDAIIEYLDEVTPLLEQDVTPEQRAKDRAWSYLAAKNYLTQCSAMRSPTEEVLAERSEKLRTAFAKVENVLGEGPYFKGESLSNVDIAWLTMLHRVDIIERHTGYDFLAGMPKVKAWQKAVLATGLAEKSVADDFEQKFTDFYLSEDTFLGNGCKSCVPTEDVCKTGTCC